MKKTEVILLSTIHGFHKDNPYYDFNDVFNLVEFYNPDVIGVEIREEDLNQSRDYLNKYYPFEMIETKFKYADQYEIVGFDYYDNDVVGILIPEDYFVNLESNNLQKAFESDPNFKKERALLDIIDQSRMTLLLNRRADEINDGKYDEVARIYYSQLEYMLKDSPYQEITRFHRNRDKHIDQHIIQIIEQNPGKRLLFMMGLDHRAFAIDAIKERFKDDVHLLKIVKMDSNNK